jgi:hypothetical protein
MQADWLRWLCDGWPNLLLGVPVAGLLLCFRRSQERLLREDISVAKLDEVFQRAVVSLPSTTLVHVHGNTTVRVADLFQDPGSRAVLQVAHRREELGNRVDALTQWKLANSLLIAGVLLVVLMFAFKLERNLAFVLGGVAVILSAYAGLQISKWNFQVRADMKVLRDHIPGAGGQAATGP